MFRHNHEFSFSSVPISLGARLQDRVLSTRTHRTATNGIESIKIQHLRDRELVAPMCSSVSRLESLSHRNFSNIRLSEETMLSSNFFASNRRCLFFSDQFSYRSIVPRSLSRLELDDDDFTIATFPSKTRRVSSKLLAKGLSPSLLSGRNCARAYTYLRSPMARARFQKHVHAAPQEFRPQLHFARPCKRMLAFAKLLLNRPPVPALAVCLALSNLRPSPRARVKNNYSRVSLVEE